VVNIEDVILFSEKRLYQDWQAVDWCGFVEDTGNIAHYKHYKTLFLYIIQYFECEKIEVDPLKIVNKNNSPIRLCLDANGRLYVSDSRTDSVFICEEKYGLFVPTGELKNLNKPIGVAVDPVGNIYVGSFGDHRIMKFSPEGIMLSFFGEDNIKMPNDLTFDKDFNLYIADSKSNVIWVYSSEGTLVRVIRQGDLKFPNAVEINYVIDGSGNMVGELYVADHDHYLVKVFDLKGNFLRSFGGFPKEGSPWRPVWNWEGNFMSIQSLAMDSLERLHVLDDSINRVQILDPVTGNYIDHYGNDETPDLFNLPLDIIVNDFGEVIVSNHDKHKVEIVFQN
jgi:DNA-binding beta-propeller fold protein YncE